MTQVLVHHCALGNDERVLLTRMYKYVGKKLKVHSYQRTNSKSTALVKPYC